MKTLGKTGFSVLCTVLALTPVWISLLANHLLQPEGFWQKLVLVGFGVWLLGFIQIILILMLIWVLIQIWSN